MPGLAVGQHVAADDLPLGGAHPEPGLADARRDGPERLGRGDDHDGEHQDGQREAAGEDRLASPVKDDIAFTKMTSPRIPYTMEGTPARLRMFALMKPVEARVPGVLLQVDGGADPEGEGDHHDDPHEEQRPPQALPDAGPGGDGRVVAGEELRAPVGEDRPPDAEHVDEEHDQHQRATGPG